MSITVIIGNYSNRIDRIEKICALCTVCKFSVCMKYQDNLLDFAVIKQLHILQFNALNLTFHFQCND